MTTETHPHTSAGMKVLLLENIHSSAHELLEENGFEVESLTGALSEAELCERVRGVQVLGIRSKTLVTPRVIEAGASAVVVISDLLQGGDPGARARDYLHALGEA